MNPIPSPFFIIREPTINESYRLQYTTSTVPNLRLSMANYTGVTSWQEQILTGSFNKFYYPECLELNFYFSRPTSTFTNTYPLLKSAKYFYGKIFLAHINALIKRSI